MRFGFCAFRVCYSPRGFAFLAAICLCYSVCATAQVMPETLTGQVTDQHHEPLRGAVILLKNENSGLVVSYLTTTTGRYRFQRIDGNSDYKVWATYRGVKSRVRSLSHFGSQKARVSDLTIRLQ